MDNLPALLPDPDTTQPGDEPPAGPGRPAAADGTAASAEELDGVYADIDGRVGTTTEQREIALAFVGAALVALLAACAAAFVWTGRFL